MLCAFTSEARGANAGNACFGPAYGVRCGVDPPTIAGMPRMIPMLHKNALVLGACVAALCAPGVGHAQLEKSAPHLAAATSVGQALRTPVVDGNLDDGAWSTAPVISGFRQHEPHEGEPASERTDVRVLFDSRAMYIAVWCWDSGADGVVVGETRRDSNLRDTDSFQFVLDTYRDRQNAFVFGTTPAGIQYDAQMSLEGGSSEGNAAQRTARQQAGSGVGLNINWDGEWTVRTSRDSAGWYAEFRIPFSTMRFGTAKQQTWGLNFQRNIRRKNEEDLWAPVPRPYTIYRLQDAGTLAGIEVPSRRTLLLTPYVLASARHDFAAGLDREYPLEAGGDAKVGLTPGLTLDLTANTDFAQVEVDEDQVNLTTFNTFFPEKRPFFLENAGFFAVGTPQAVELFSSRRIGISPDGAPIPIIGGGRMSGQLGSFKVGLLDIQTNRLGDIEPANNYAVARISRPLANRSRIGVVVLNRQATSTGYAHSWNRSAGIDGRLGLGASINFDAYIAKTSTPGLSGRDHAFNLRGEYLTRDWNASGNFTEVGEDFNPEIGFLGRSGYRYFQQQTYHYFRRNEWKWMRQFEPHYTYKGYFDFEGRRLSGMMHLDPTIRFANGGQFSPAMNWTWEGLQEPFETVGGVIVKPGLYQYWLGDWHVTTDPSVPISLDSRLNFGGYLSGTRRGFSPTVTLRPTGGTLAFTLRYSYDDVRLAEGSFVAQLFAVRAAYSFTPTSYVQSLVQYSSLTRTWSTNLRFGWLHSDGTGLFIVLNDQELSEISRDVRPNYRGVTVKFTRRVDLIR
jgi:hypothetical protein